MKKIICLILCVLALFATGCKRKPPAEVGGDYAVNINPDKNAKIELRVTTTGSKDETKIIEELGKGFKKEYPNVTIKVDPLSGKIYDTMMSYYRAGKMPDIFINNSFDMLTLGGAKVILNMDPYIKAEEAAKTFNTSDYYESFWKLGQEKFDGGQWMIPRAADQVVLHMNKVKLKAAGVDMNPETTVVKNGWSWDDFLSVLAQLRTYYDANGESNLYLVDGYLNWEANFNAIFESFGVKYYGEGDTVSIKSEETKKALKLMKNLVEKKYVAKFSAPSQANFDGGQGAFMMHSRASSLSMKGLEKAYEKELKDGTYTMDDIYDVVTFPLIGETPKVGAGVAGYSISSTISAEKRDYAWQFMKYMLTKEGQNIIAECGTNYPPIRKDMANPKDPTNKWGKGYEKMNLEAYTWAAQEGHNYICPTTYILKRPAMANDLMDSVKTMISGYLDFSFLNDSKEANEKLIKVMDSCEADLRYWAFEI